MESHFTRSNSTFEIEDAPFDAFPTSTSGLFSSHHLGSPLPIEKNYMFSPLEDPSNFLCEEKNQEYVVQYDIFGKSITRTHLSSPNANSSNRMSSEYGHSIFHTESPSNTAMEIDYEPTEWDIEKENIDPKGALTTPYKSKRTGLQNPSSNSMTRGGSTSGRTPLMDITPPVIKRKAVAQWTGIEVKQLLISLVIIEL